MLDRNYVSLLVCREFPTWHRNYVSLFCPFDFGDWNFENRARSKAFVGLAFEAVLAPAFSATNFLVKTKIFQLQQDFIPALIMSQGKQGTKNNFPVTVTRSQFWNRCFPVSAWLNAGGNFPVTITRFQLWDLCFSVLAYFG